VERAEAYLRADAGKRVPLATISRLLGLSERGLRNAFYDVRGMSPQRYMRAERLEEARRALRQSDGRLTTVTGVATRYGFYELGRFAVTYRNAFGEAPSETLRGGSRKSALMGVRKET
jgi:transcriptional regulator GlxA family with amidase domain